MLGNEKLDFKKGCKDGIPIAIGYLAVSFTFGILAAEYKLPEWALILTSFSNFTGTGQFVGMELLHNNAPYYQLVIMMIVINIRYMLMSISISQKMDSKVGFFKRMMISFGVTDEVYAVSMLNSQELNFKYLMGLMISAYIGWVTGTTVGAFASNIIPLGLLSAMGITIYAMFIAIIVPPTKEDKAVLTTVLISIIISCLLSFIKVLKENSFIIVLVAGIVSTLIVTFTNPIKDEVDTSQDVAYERDVVANITHDVNIPTIEYDRDKVQDIIDSESVYTSDNTSDKGDNDHANN